MAIGTQIHDFELGFLAGVGAGVDAGRTGMTTGGAFAAGAVLMTGGGGITGAAATAVPQFGQNCAPGAMALPQLEQNRLSTNASDRRKRAEIRRPKPGNHAERCSRFRSWI